MPIDLAQVDWLYVIMLAVFVAVSTFLGGLLSFGHRGMDLSDAAQLHAIAARKAGASWEEMQAVVSLCFLFRGLPAANRGAEILANLAKRETEAKAEGRL